MKNQATVPPRKRIKLARIINLKSASLKTIDNFESELKASRLEKDMLEQNFENHKKISKRRIEKLKTKKGRRNYGEEERDKAAGYKALFHRKFERIMYTINSVPKKYIDGIIFKHIIFLLQKTRRDFVFFLQLPNFIL